MKMKALLKVLAAPEDLEQLQEVFEHLRKNGVRISQKTDSLEKKDLVLTVLSERFYADEKLKAQLFDQLAVGADMILPLNIGQVPVPEEIMNLLFARNIIMASGRTDEQLGERILSAIPEKKNHITVILIAAVAVLALLGGLFLWRSISQGKGEAVIAAEEPIPNPLGITEKELAEIQDVVIIGDQFRYFTLEDYQEYHHWPTIEDFAYEVTDENGSHWYSNEDGHEFTMTPYDDLRFLELMPNLRMIHMVLVDTEADRLPDLSASDHLTDISIRRCSMTDISWISGKSVRNLDVFETNIVSYQPLTNCDNLSKATIHADPEADSDFRGFAPPALIELDLYGQNEYEDLTALSTCQKLTYLRLNNLELQNLDFLKGMPWMKSLELTDLHQLRDISGIAELTGLRELRIMRCDSIRDYMPINACRNLEIINIDRWDWISMDSAFLNGLTKLRDIGLFGLNLNNMDFLADVNQDFGLCLSFCGDIQDYSGMSHIRKYQWLHVNPRTNGGRYGDFSAVAPHIQNATIAEMELYNCINVDLTALPVVNHRLVLTGGILEDLTGLKALPIQCLELKDMQYLRSLKGIENLSKLSMGALELSIMGCIRLTDYSPLDGTSVRSLNLCGMYTLPDFSRFSLKNLRLESIEEMEDLTCLEPLDRDQMYYFSFPGLTDLKDLSILHDFKGIDLFVPPQVADQAEELVQSGNFINCKVVYPESGWNPTNEEVTLLSMEELETLPKVILRRVSRVWIAGDEIIDPDRYEVKEEWENDHPIAVLYDRETEKTRKLSSGKIHDFSLLSELTNLRDLRLFSQPITSLEGIQNLSNLVCFYAEYCTGLQDVSALYTLQNLEEISFQMAPVDSIQGLQNLPKLRVLNIGSTYVTDMTPMIDCDFSYSETNDGFCLVTHNTYITDLSPIARIPYFGHLNLCGYPPELWMQYVENTYIRGYCGPMGDDETLQKFVQQHPELEELHIENGYELTDLTPLLELPNLTYVHIWNNAENAVRSLDGHSRNFQLDVE